MKIEQMPLMKELKNKILWLQDRYNIVAENVANASAEGYKPKDLSKFEIGKDYKVITQEGSVALIKEMNKAAEIRQSHAFAVSVYGKYMSMVSRHLSKLGSR